MKLTRKQCVSGAIKNGTMLNSKEKRFIAEYLVDLDPKRAALAAGYSKTVAATKAYQWVSNSKVKPCVYAAIAKAQAKTATKLEITRERIIQEYGCMAFLDPRDIFEDNGSIKLIRDMPESARRAMASFDVNEIFDRAEGDQKTAIGLTKRVKFHGKREALRDLSEMLGFMKGTQDVNVTLRFAYDIPEIKQ